MAEMDKERALDETRRVFEDVVKGRNPGDNSRPPRDWLDADAWDRYWVHVIGDPMLAELETVSPFESYPIQTLPHLRQRGARRVLFAGNGISLEPHAWVHAGFDVTALDISPAASKLVQETRLEDQLLPHFFPEYEERREDGMTVARRSETPSQSRAEPEYRPGGRLTVLTENLFTHTPVESYDAIFSIRAFQGFPPEEQMHLAARFHEWLSPGGLCLVEAINLDGKRYEWLESAFISAGFFQQGRTVREVSMRSSDESDVDAYLREIQAAHAQNELEERDRLARGEKMFLFIHGSG